MKRKLSNRQVTLLGVLIGLLITGGIVGLWSTVRHIHDEERRAEEAKDSARSEHREQLAIEIAKEQALQDSIATYQSTHSPEVLARRMQVILSDELKHASTRPYYDKYRTEAFKEDLQTVISFDKEPREEKPGMTFLDMPFYQLIPAKMIRDLIIKRIYYVTNDRARVDVRYLVKREEKLEYGETEKDTIYYEPKTATYKLAYQDGEWMVDDRIIDYLSERAAFKRYMDGEYFIDPVIVEETDSILSDSITKAEDHQKTKKDAPQSDVKKKEEAKPKNDAKKKDEAKPKNDVKKKDEAKPKNDAKKKDEAKPKNDAKKKDEAKPAQKKTEKKPTNNTKK